jgi:hypothetical protein
MPAKVSIFEVPVALWKWPLQSARAGVAPDTRTNAPTKAAACAARANEITLIAYSPIEVLTVMPGEHPSPGSLLQVPPDDDREGGQQ